MRVEIFHSSNLNCVTVFLQFHFLLASIHPSGPQIFFTRTFFHLYLGVITSSGRARLKAIQSYQEVDLMSRMREVPDVCASHVCI